MNQTEQISMFEPVGSELAQLAKIHSSSALKFQRQASNLSLCGRVASAAAFALLGDLSEERANVCEMALQFELLAGLAGGDADCDGGTTAGAASLRVAHPVGNTGITSTSEVVSE